MVETGGEVRRADLDLIARKNRPAIASHSSRNNAFPKLLTHVVLGPIYILHYLPLSASRVIH